MLDSGNQLLQVTSATQSDANDYTLTPNATTDCQPSLVSGGSATLTVGGVCALTTSYTPTTYVPTTDTVTLNGNMDNAQLSTPPLVQFVLTGPTTAPASSITISSFLPSSPVYGQSVTVYATVSGATLLPAGTVTFYLDGSSTPAGSGTVNSSGVASALLPGLIGGLHTVSAAYTSTNGYAPSTTSLATSFNIALANPTLAWATPAAITYGTALSGTQLNAMATGVTGASLPGTFTYSPLSGTVLTGGSQTLSVSFAPTDSTDYATVTTTVQIQVNKANPTLAWATPAAITYGTALSGTQLNASATGVTGASLPGTFTYSPLSGTVLTAGSQTLSVSFVPTDTTDYTTPATVTVQLQVNKANPTLAWATPAAITYGTALSGTQLDAVAKGVTGASLPGTFTYSPLSGTVLTTGSQTLSVSFVPTDTTDYTTPATATVQLQVNKAASAVLLTSSLNPILLQNPVTYTATVSSAAGLPTGTVTFEDGGVALTACTGVSVTTATGLASCAVTYTATGTHSITVLYNGDTNFLSAGPSNTVSEAAIDINLGSALSGSGTGSAETILPGGTATYSFPLAPSSGTSFPSAVTFTVTGLPTGATATLTPSAWGLTSNNPWTWTLPANTTLTGTTVLSIQVPQTIAAVQPAGSTGGNLASRLAPFSLALLVLPFVGRLRRSSKRFSRMLPILLLLVAGMAAMAGLSGCGSNTGFFAQAQRSYPMTVTVSSGSLSHTSTITLTVE
jgi:hypothetical protein